MHERFKFEKKKSQKKIIFFFSEKDIEPVCVTVRLCQAQASEI